MEPEEKWRSKRWDINFVNLFFEAIQGRVPADQSDYVKSLRRTKALSNFLTAIYMKAGTRLPEHYISAARSILVPGLQALGEEVAREILFGKVKPPPEQASREKQMMEYMALRQLLRAGPQAPYILSQLTPLNEGMEDEELQNLKKMLFRVWAGAGRDRQLTWMENDEALAELRVPLEKIIKIGRSYHKKFSEKKDGFGEHLIRPFQIGDDPDSIDYDETIENLHDQGKKVEQLRYDDILVKDTRKRRWCITYLHDISWSMEGSISITNEILATLLQAFREDEYAIGLFRDDFYVMKSIEERRDVDRLTANILTLRPFGGTVLVRGLDWAKEGFERAGRNVEKICFILGDFMFYWPALTYTKVKQMMRSGVKIVGISTGTGAQSWTDNTGAPIVNIIGILSSAKDMEDLIMKSMDELYRAVFLKAS